MHSNNYTTEKEFTEESLDKIYDDFTQVYNDRCQENSLAVKELIVMNNDFAFAKNFLISIAAFSNFDKEIQYGVSCHEDFCDYSIKHGLNDDFIVDAFDWMASRHGHHYWKDVDCEWRSWFDA
jgi:hypothetical protein